MEADAQKQGKSDQTQADYEENGEEVVRWESVYSVIWLPAAFSSTVPENKRAPEEPDECCKDVQR